LFLSERVEEMKCYTPPESKSPQFAS